MSQFHSTYLYVKTHTVTGLKYFGKTTSKNPYKYRGSGLHWKRHIKKHGNHVQTEILGLFTDQIWCNFYALEFSHQEKIVESKEWANLKEEDGIDGGFSHINSNMSDEEKERKIELLNSVRHLGNKSMRENGTGFYDSKLQSILGARGSVKAKEMGVGAIFGLTPEQKDENRKLCYTEEARKKHSETANIRRSYDGIKNSQFGRKFVYNPELEVSFRIEGNLVPSYLDQGWLLGKHSNQFFSNGKINSAL